MKTENTQYAESFAKWHDERARFGGMCQEFHERAASFLRTEYSRALEDVHHAIATDTRIIYAVKDVLLQAAPSAEPDDLADEIIEAMVEVLAVLL